MVFELFQKLHLQIYASQFMTSKIIPIAFVLLNLESAGREKITKTWISSERKELFRWNLKKAHSFWRALIWWKNKNLIKKGRTQALCDICLHESGSNCSFPFWKILFIAFISLLAFAWIGQVLHPISCDVGRTAYGGNSRISVKVLKLHSGKASLNLVNV